MSLFRASLRDNNTYAFREHPVLTATQQIHQAMILDMSGAAYQAPRRCEECGELISKSAEPLPNVVVKNRRHDLAMTYDGVLIGSDKFKSVYLANNLSGLEFRELPDDPQFFAVHATRAVEFDSERRKTRFIKPCQCCGRYESVVGATPVFLKSGTEVGEREFVRTDIEFGSGDEKHPLLICGNTAARVLCDAKLKGPDWIPIDDIAINGL